jgi:hypothetical protein
VYRKEKDIPLFGPKHTPLSSWKLGLGRSQLGTKLCLEGGEVACVHLHLINKEHLPLELASNNRRPTIPLNRPFATCKRGTLWKNDALETTMDVVEKGTHSLRKASRTWNIFLSSLFDHLNGKTRFKKMGLTGVFIIKKDVEMINWTLAM